MRKMAKKPHCFRQKMPNGNQTFQRQEASVHKGKGTRNVTDRQGRKRRGPGLKSIDHPCSETNLTSPGKKIKSNGEEGKIGENESQKKCRKRKKSRKQRKYCGFLRKVVPPPRGGGNPKTSGLGKT